MTTKTRKPRKRLSNYENDSLVALEKVGGKADVWNPITARSLRGVETKRPNLILIVKAQMAPKDGTKGQPYFGVVLTRDGHEYLEARK